MRQLRVTSPEGVGFTDLALDDRFGQRPGSFQHGAHRDHLQGQRLGSRGTRDGPVLLVTAWYRVHVSEGGAPDPVQEDLLEETRLELELDGGFSYAPGHA